MRGRRAFSASGESTADITLICCEVVSEPQAVKVGYPVPVSVERCSYRATVALPHTHIHAHSMKFDTFVPTCFLGVPYVMRLT